MTNLNKEHKNEVRLGEYVPLELGANLLLFMAGMMYILKTGRVAEGLLITGVSGLAVIVMCKSMERVENYLTTRRKI